jgi:hypothetical protein
VKPVAHVLLAIAPLWAHHSFSAEFDAKRPVRLEGAIVKLEWINPHAEIYIAVPGPDGELVPWTVEAGSPNALQRRGFTKTSVSAGTRVVVEGYQAKSGAHRATGIDILLPDGQKLFLNSNGPETP